MKQVNEGNVYNVETSKMSPDRSKELDDTTKIMMDQFWKSMARQSISPEVAKQIAKHTFAQKSDTQS